MTEQDKTSKLSIHPLAAALAEDPSSPRDTIQVVGYVGTSPRAEHVRVYLSLAFDEYLDVPRPAILHHADVPDTELPHGGTRLWVDASAQVIHETRQTTRTEARFLEGAIAAEHLQEGAAEPAAGARAFGTVAADQIARPLVSINVCELATRVSRCPIACMAITVRTACAQHTCNTRVCFPTTRCPLLTRLCPRTIGWCGGPYDLPRTAPIDVGFELDPAGATAIRQPMEPAFGAAYGPGGPGPQGAAAYGYGPPYGWPYIPWSR